MFLKRADIMAGSERDVGAKIRAFRQRRGLSLNQLSETTGIAASNLSSLELNKSSPTLNTLIRIADAFNIKVGAFLDEVLYERAVTCRRGRGKILEVRTPGHYIEKLTHQLPGSTLEAHFISLKRGSEPLRQACAGGYGFLYCLSGRVTVHVDQQKQHLNTGDSLHLLPDAEVILRNEGRREAGILYICGSSPA